MYDNKVFVWFLIFNKSDDGLIDKPKLVTCTFCKFCKFFVWMRMVCNIYVYIWMEGTLL
jgi:hypothetical protein